MFIKKYERMILKLTIKIYINNIWIIKIIMVFLKYNDKKNLGQKYPEYYNLMNLIKRKKINYQMKKQLLLFDFIH
ncbi:hypothetical protein BpHYR1_012571 [Brachionus plicatilis]|uniref:Uncharacterized protein n=1 Tax=Brachionus plicatilis TaxID=10195 RepID=A0A3M7PI26_BRAPC|nr:hypothetical protein BpHYR1_012571 [Brachionus plicatilis]